MRIVLVQEGVALRASPTLIFLPWERRLLRLIQVQFQIDDSRGYLEIKLLDELGVAVFKLAPSAFFKSDLNLKLLPKVLLILPHLLHRQSKSLLSLDYLPSGLSFVGFPPLVELFGKALKVVDQRLYLSISAITLVLQLLDLLVDQFALQVELILQLEQLVGD